MRRHDHAAEPAKSLSEPGDVFAALLEDRVVFLAGEINSERANMLCGQILALALQDPERDISLFINSEGGNVTDTMAIYDVLQAVPCDVSTICIGEAASGAAIVLSGGTKGKRFALPNARIMLHQPQGGVEGSSRDVEIEARELQRLREMMTDILRRTSALSPDALKSVMERDTYLNAQDTQAAGLIDGVLDRLPI